MNTTWRQKMFKAIRRKKMERPLVYRWGGDLHQLVGGRWLKLDQTYFDKGVRG